MVVISKLKGPGVILGLLLSITVASACLWVTGTTYDGHSKRVLDVGAATHLRSFLGIDHREDGVRMEAALANSTNFNDRSDYAVSLVYLGKVEEAVNLLRTLERERPGTYFVAANLGTALELMGKNQEALQWIREGIRRNPESHEGTEWLHAKILEAKIAQERDPAYFKGHSVLELDPKQMSGAMNIDGRTFSPKEVAEAIQYQLQERLQFVKPPDPAVASLLFDYAAIEASTNILESAKELLEMAEDYGYAADRVQTQIKLYDRKIEAGKAEQALVHTRIVRQRRASVLVFAAIGGLIILYKMRNYFLGPKNLRNKTAEH